MFAPEDGERVLAAFKGRDAAVNETDFFSKSGDNREQMRTIRWEEVEAGRGETTPEQIWPFLRTHDDFIEYNEIGLWEELPVTGDQPVCRDVAIDL